jgi:hypothetical protein
MAALPTTVAGRGDPAGCQAVLVAVDDRDVVVFGNQTFGDAGPDLAGAENDDPHFLP